MQKTAQKVQLERLPPLALLPALAAAVLALSACANTDKAARASAGAQEADSAYIMEETLSEYTKEELYVEAEGRQIFGVLYLPKMGEGRRRRLRFFRTGSEARMSGRIHTLPPLRKRDTRRLPLTFAAAGLIAAARAQRKR